MKYGALLVFLFLFFAGCSSEEERCTTNAELEWLVTGGTKITTCFFFSWNSSNEYSEFDLEVATDESFKESAIISSTTIDDSQNAEVSFNERRSYYARVRGVQLDCVSEWSSTLVFYLDIFPESPCRFSDELEQVVLLDPSPGADLEGPVIELDWQSQLSDTYRVQISGNELFDNVDLYYDKVVFNSERIIPGVPVGDYNWRVQAIDGEDAGPWSAIWSFSVIE
ncbi:hypothetical protein N8482_01140 [Chitinophagales bacterium]|nr:hypothetical protein [Chitinophagales bacterium]